MGGIWLVPLEPGWEEGARRLVRLLMDGLRYRARFWSSDASSLRDLFQIVGGSDATEVLIDDRPVPYARELWLPLVWFLIPR